MMFNGVLLRGKNKSLNDDIERDMKSIKSEQC
jgi:hypothetical protein